MSLTGKAVRKGLRLRFISDRSASGSGAQCTVEAISGVNLGQLAEDLLALKAELEDDYSQAPDSKPFPTIIGPAKDDKVHTKIFITAYFVNAGMRSGCWPHWCSYGIAT